MREEETNRDSFDKKIPFQYKMQINLFSILNKTIREPIQLKLYFKKNGYLFALFRGFPTSSNNGSGKKMMLREADRNTLF